jgi:hypothetical protein
VIFVADAFRMDDTAAMGDFLQPWHLIILLVVGTPLLAINFLPTIIAGVRKVRNFGWILTINLLLGWTVIGWVVALIWAFRDEPKDGMAYMPPPSSPPYNGVLR